VGIYRCPGDKSTIEDENGKKLSQPRTRSYNLSQPVNGWPEFKWSVSQYMPSFKKTVLIDNPGPTQLFVFIEVHEDKIMDAHFGIPTPERHWNPKQWWDLPADRHNQAANLVFADGHSEHWRWEVPKIPVWHGYLRDDEWGDYNRVQGGIRQYWGF
jgi:prepilin-type processing-associated H-X9-DG protein